MHNSVIVTASAVIIGAFGFSAGVGTIEVSHSLFMEAPKRNLVVNRLEYADGIITQNIGPAKGTGVDGISAVWTASIKRGEKLLCGPGSDKGNYTGENTKFTPAEWTGDPLCPDRLQRGDRASATWEWRRADGLIMSVTGTILITDENSPLVSRMENQ